MQLMLHGFFRFFPMVSFTCSERIYENQGTYVIINTYMLEKIKSYQK